MTRNEEIVRGFIRMMETRESVDQLDAFYHPDVQQIEYPNAILKATAFRSLQDLKDGAERGRKVMSKESYDIIRIHALGDIVILEAVWKGTLAIPLGNIPVGGQMTAYFAQFFEIKDGKIYRQRNYDCFEPF